MTCINHSLTRKDLFQSSWSKFAGLNEEVVQGASTLSFSSGDGNYCAIGLWDGRVLIWELSSIRTVLRELPSPFNQPNGYFSSNPSDVVNYVSVRSLDWNQSCDGEWLLCVGYFFETATTTKVGSTSDGKEDDIASQAKKLKPNVTTTMSGLVSCWNVGSTSIVWSKELGLNSFPSCIVSKNGMHTTHLQTMANKPPTIPHLQPCWFMSTSDSQVWLLPCVSSNSNGKKSASSQDVESVVDGKLVFNCNDYKDCIDIQQKDIDETINVEDVSHQSRMTDEKEANNSSLPRSTSSASIETTSAPAPHVTPLLSVTSLVSYEDKLYVGFGSKIFLLQEDDVEKKMDSEFSISAENDTHCGSSFHLVKESLQPGNCNSPKLLSIYQHELFKDYSADRSSIEKTRVLDGNGSGGGSGGGDGSGGGGKLTSDLRWLIGSFGSSIRILDALTLECVFDLGRGMCKGHSKKVWAALTTTRSDDGNYLCLYGSAMCRGVAVRDDRDSENFKYVCLFKIPLFHSEQSQTLPQSSPIESPSASGSASASASLCQDTMSKTATSATENESDIKMNSNELLHTNNTPDTLSSYNTLVGAAMVLTAVPVHRVHFMMFHPTKRMLFLISDVRGEVDVLEQTVTSNFAGPMYPPGFEVVEDNLPYYEAEDELDTVVDMHGNVIKEEADISEDTGLVIDAFGGETIPQNSGHKIRNNSRNTSSSGNPIDNSSEPTSRLCIDKSAMMNLLRQSTNRQETYDLSSKEEKEDNVMNMSPVNHVSSPGKAPATTSLALTRLLNPDMATLLPQLKHVSEQDYCASIGYHLLTKSWVTGTNHSSSSSSTVTSVAIGATASGKKRSRGKLSKK